MKSFSDIFWDNSSTRALQAQTCLKASNFITWTRLVGTFLNCRLNCAHAGRSTSPQPPRSSARSQPTSSGREWIYDLGFVIQIFYLFKALRGRLWDRPREGGGDADVPPDREVRPLPAEHEVHVLPPLLPGPRGSQCIHQVQYNNNVV